MYDESKYEIRPAEKATPIAAAMAGVYWWMTFALAVSGLSAYMVGTSEKLTRMLVQNPGVFFGLAIVEIIMVIAISAGINKLSAATATALFILYAAVNGLTLAALLPMMDAMITLGVLSVLIALD